jgi:primosomal protein N' (replication factor Y)
MKNNIAEVAVPISFALNEQFDYFIPTELEGAVVKGSRVMVSFRLRREIGYVMELKSHSAFKDRLKPIEAVLDPKPLLDPFLFKMAHKIQQDYFCSLSEAIATVVPCGNKKFKPAVFQETPVFSFDHQLKLSAAAKENLKVDGFSDSVVLIHDLSNERRWSYYSSIIKKSLNGKKSVIFLVPDHAKIKTALKRLQIDIQPVVMSSTLLGPESLKDWLSVKEAPVSWVVGTRSAVFAPVNNLGVIIMEEEDHFAYRSDQVPFYKTFDLSLFKTQEFKAQLVCGSVTPSLETYVFVHDIKNKARYLKLDKKKLDPTVRLVDTRLGQGYGRRMGILSKTLENAIADVLQKKQKMLIFVQKKGFSTFLYCKKCKNLLTCPHCSSSLVFHFNEKILMCSTCRYTSKPLEICPTCRSSYIKYFGFGTEKVDSEITRLFPTARIVHYDAGDSERKEYDIMLATQKFLEDPETESYVFDRVAVLGCEQMLGHLDFRSTEKTFSRLLRLSLVADQELLIQTQITENDALKFLQKFEVEPYYENEYRQREESGLPPAVFAGVLSVRCKGEENAGQAAQDIFKKIKKRLGKSEDFKCFEPVKAIPFKVRGNYRYQILIKYKTLTSLRNFLMEIIRKRTRATIVTFDPYL